MTDMFGQYKSQETKALQNINSSKYPDTNVDLERNIQRLNSFVDYISQYLQIMQKGVDQANQDMLQRTRDMLQNMGVLLAGGAIFDNDYGDLQYFLPVIGALLGFDKDTPFPLNLFQAAETFFLGYIVPLDSFGEIIQAMINDWGDRFNLNEEFLLALNDLLDAWQATGSSFTELLNNIRDMFEVMGIGPNGLGPFADLWNALARLLGGFDLGVIGDITDPILGAMAPWLQQLAKGIDNLNRIIKAWSKGVEDISGIINFASIFNGVDWASPTFTPAEALRSWMENAMVPTGIFAGSDALASVADIADQARQNADEALANFALILQRFGFTKVSDWISDLLVTRGAASTAEANAATAAAKAALAEDLAKIGILRAKFGSNLVYSPNFEDSTIGRVAYTSLSPTAYVYSTEQKHSGTQSLKITYDAAAVTAGAQGIQMRVLPSEAFLPTQPLAWFWVEAWVYLPAAHSNAGNVQLFIDARDSKGVNATQWPIAYSQPVSGITRDQWVKIQGHVQVPAGLDQIVLILFRGSGTLNDVWYVDDVVMREVTEAKLANELATAAQALANTAKANADQAIANFTAILNKFGFVQISDWINDIYNTKGVASTAHTNSNTALANFATVLNKFGLPTVADWANDLWGTKGTATTANTNATNAQGTANTASTNANTALTNFTTVLNKFGLPTVADWANDLWGTKGTATTAGANASTAITNASNAQTTANTANTTANTAKTNADQALSNFTTVLTKFGLGTVALWADDLFGTKGTANTALTNASTANANASTAISNVNKAVTNFTSKLLGGTNIVVNPSFSDTSIPVPSYGAPASAGYSTEQKHTGTTSWKWVQASSAFNGIWFPLSFNGDTMAKVVAGDRFYIECWIYPATTNSGTGGGYFGALFEDSTGTNPLYYSDCLFNGASQNPNFASIPRGQWTKLRGYVGPAPTGYDTMRIYMQATTDVPAGDVFYVDDLILREVTEGYNADTKAGAAQGTANTASTNASQALTNFTTVLTKFGLGTVALWADDLWGTKGTASTASANASTAITNASAAQTTANTANSTAGTANTNANQALANFTTVLNKFGLGTVAAWADDLFATKGTATTANTNATNASTTAGTANTNANTAIANAANARTIAINKIFQGVNLCTNPSFEFANSPASGPNSSISTDFARTGTKSLKLVGADSYSWLAVDDQGTKVAYNCSPGDVYYAEAWIRGATTNTGSSGSNSGNFRFEIQDSTGTVFSWPAAASFAHSTALNGVWTKISGYYTMPAGAAKFSIYFDLWGVVIPAGQTYYVDDVVCREVTVGYNANINASNAQGTANTASTNATTALNNFSTVLTKFGLGTVALWADDLWGTKGTATTASSNANTAITNASTAQTTANTANTTANTANTTATTANTNANTAISNAATAQTTANVAKVASTQTGTNIITNPGFENAGFTNYGQTDTAQKHSGTRSLKLVANGTNYITSPLTCDNVTTTRIPCTAGDKFYVEFWVYGAATNVTTTSNVWVQFDAFDANMSSFSYPVVTVNGGTALNGKWTKVTGYVTMPANTAFYDILAVVDMNCPNGNTYWFDDVIAREVTAGYDANTSATAAQGTANTASTNATTALNNFTTVLTKFGLGTVSAWADDLFATKGTANTASSTATTANNTANTANSTATTASTTANTANTNANTALGNFTTMLNKFGLGTVSLLADDLFATKGTASTANSTANTANSTATTANSTANTANTNANTSLGNFTTLLNKFGIATVPLWGDDLVATKSTASTANSTANTANSTANTAKTNAATADAKAVTADGKAVTAQSAASTADSKAVTADGKAVTAQNTANTANTNANTGITNAAVADGKVSTLKLNIANSFTAEELTDAGQEEARAAMVQLYAAVQSNTNRLNELLASNNNPGGNKGVTYNINFADYASLAAAGFTVTYSGPGTATVDIGVNGVAQWMNVTNVSRDAKILYNQPTLTDFQLVRGTMTTPPQQGASAVTPPKFHALLRVSNDGNSYVFGRAYCDGLLSFKGELGYVVNGVETVWLSNIPLTWSLDMTIAAGVGTNARQYQVYSGGKLVVTYTETGTASQMGPNNRRWGSISQLRSGTGINAPFHGGKLAGCNMSDNETPSIIGSAARMFRASTGEVTFAGGNTETPLPASFFSNIPYETRDVDANTADGTFTVTRERLYHIEIRLNMSSAVTAVCNVLLQVSTGGGAFTTVQQGTSMQTGNAGVALTGSWIQYLKAGDKVRIATLRGGVNVNTWAGDAAGTQTYFAIAGIG